MINYMEKAKIYLFTTATCPNCPAVKDFMEEYRKTRDDIHYQLVDCSTPKGQRMARENSISTVPTIFIKGYAHPEVIGLRGLQNKETMDKYVDIALGKRNVETETSFMDKVKGFFG